MKVLSFWGHFWNEFLTSFHHFMPKWLYIYEPHRITALFKKEIYEPHVLWDIQTFANWYDLFLFWGVAPYIGFFLLWLVYNVGYGIEDAEGVWDRKGAGYPKSPYILTWEEFAQKMKRWRI